jgi:hypothetical protein
LQNWGKYKELAERCQTNNIDYEILQGYTAERKTWRAMYQGKYESARENPLFPLPLSIQAQILTFLGKEIPHIQEFYPEIEKELLALLRQMLYDNHFDQIVILTGDDGPSKLPYTFFLRFQPGSNRMIFLDPYKYLEEAVNKLEKSLDRLGFQFHRMGHISFGIQPNQDFLRQFIVPKRERLKH